MYTFYYSSNPVVCVSLQITQTLDHDLDCFLNQAGSISDIAVDCRAIEQETPEGHSSDARA